jgi:hypothetical protein
VVGISSRVLGWAGAEPDEQRDPKIRAAWIIVSLHVCIRLTLAAWFAGAHYLMPLPAALFALGLLRPYQRPVATVLAVVQCVRFGFTYPDVSNHYLVECLAMLAFAAVDLTREQERALCLRALCWLAALVLFMSGVQKLLHGCYFEGQYLAYMVASTDRFSDFFSPMLSAADLDHLRCAARAPTACSSASTSRSARCRSLPGRLLAVHRRVQRHLAGRIVVPLGLLWRRTAGSRWSRAAAHGRHRRVVASCSSTPCSSTCCCCSRSPRSTAPCCRCRWPATATTCSAGWASCR